MRWPIQRQLLLPFLTVVLVTIAVSSVLNAYWIAETIGKEQQAELNRVVSTLSNSQFPLTDTVLKQISGLSGAQFVVFDHKKRLKSTSLSIDSAHQKELANLELSDAETNFDNQKTITIHKQDYLCNRIAVVNSNVVGPQSSLVVLYPEERWRTATSEAFYPPVQVGLCAAVVVVLLTTWLSWRFVKPIESLRIHASQMAQGEFTPFPLGSRNDEIRDLGISLNQMAEQLAKYEDQVRKNERLKTLGQLGGGIAHQLRNSVTGALLALELHERVCPLQQDEGHPQAESLIVAQRQLKLMKTYIQRFLTLGQTQDFTFAPMELDALVEEVVELIRPTCQHMKIEMEFQKPSDSVMINGDHDALRQMIVNLVMNGIEAASQPSDHPANVVIQLVPETETQEILLTISDSGPGPAKDVADKIFEPFVTEKPDGTGLGLSVCRQIAEQHQGSIDWKREDQATSFIVKFPQLSIPTSKSST